MDLWEKKSRPQPPWEWLRGGEVGEVRWHTGRAGAEADLQCEQQLDGIGEGRGGGQAQQAERAEEQEVGEGPGEGQGVAGAGGKGKRPLCGARGPSLEVPTSPKF